MRTYRSLGTSMILVLIAVAIADGAKKDRIPSRKAKAVVPLLRNLSPEARFEDVLEILGGEMGPDTGSGIHIHHFPLKGGKSVRVGTPDHVAVSYIDLMKKDGSRDERLFPAPVAGRAEARHLAIERKFANLNARHEELLSNVVAPVTARYRNALAELLKEAEDAGSTSTAMSILTAYLEGTEWAIRNGSPEGKALYTLTFSGNGRFRHSDGTTGVWKATGPRDLKLWNWDPATLNTDLAQFRAVGTGVIYFGSLKQPEIDEDALRKALGDAFMPIDISLPAVSEPGSLESAVGELIIEVTENGTFEIEEKNVSKSEILELLKDLAKSHKDQAVIIRGDRETSYDHIVACLNVCQKAGIWNIAFATKP